MDFTRMKIGLLLWIWCAFLEALYAQPGFIEVKGHEFFTKSELIFVGKVISQKSYRSADGRFIFTRHLFEVQDTVKGKFQQTIELVEYGGRVGNETLAVSHSPRYAKGQEYLVFTYIDLLGHKRTLAGPLGQLAILQDQSGQRTVRIYSSHPLRQVPDIKSTNTFQELKDFTKQLHNAMTRFSHEKK